MILSWNVTLSLILCEQSSSPSLAAPIVYGMLSSMHEFRWVEISNICKQGQSPYLFVS